jgi:hypothetical protein
MTFCLLLYKLDQLTDAIGIKEFVKNISEKSKSTTAILYFKYTVTERKIF